MEIELSQPISSIAAAEVFITPEKQNDFIILLYQCGSVAFLKFDGKKFQEIILQKVNEPLLPKLRVHKNFIGIQYAINKCTFYFFDKINNELKKVLIFRSKHLKILDLQIITEFPLTFVILALSYSSYYLIGQLKVR